jgi:hypothetical protein
VYTRVPRVGDQHICMCTHVYTCVHTHVVCMFLHSRGGERQTVGGERDRQWGERDRQWGERETDSGGRETDRITAVDSVLAINLGKPFIVACIFRLTRDQKKNSRSQCPTTFPMLKLLYRGLLRIDAERCAPPAAPPRPLKRVAGCMSGGERERERDPGERGGGGVE